MDFSCIATTVVLHNMYNKNVSRKIGQHLNKSKISFFEGRIFYVPTNIVFTDFSCNNLEIKACSKNIPCLINCFERH